MADHASSKSPLPVPPRGHEVSRVEAFSDAVMAFAVTLIVVSLEVPRTFADLLTVLRGFPVFAICFALLLQVWYQHYKFFRRFGLQDGPTIALNSVLLFVVVFYVYPLKFLFSEALGLRPPGAPPAFANDSEVRATFALYGGGFCAVFVLLAAMYAHALRKGDELQLTARERFEAWTSICSHIGMVAVGLLSIVLAEVLPSRWLGLPGFVYFLTGVSEFAVGTIRGSMQRRQPGE